MKSDSRLPPGDARLALVQRPTPLLTERSIINFLIWTGGLILGPYLAITAVEYNFYPIGAFVAACAVVAVFAFMRDRMSILPLIGTFIAGKFNFIPVLHPAPTELFPLALVAYYFIAYVALQRKKFLTGPLYFFIPILILSAIILYHEHSFGVRAFSGSGGREGGRGAIFVLVATMAYLCGISLGSPSPRFLALTPLFCIAATLISAIPYTVTTYFPGTAPYFYIFTDSINDSAYSASMFDVGDVVRNQAQASAGAAIMTFLLAYYPIYTWWRPQRWWIVALALGCIVLVVMGGYRSALAAFGFTILVAVWCYSSWRALALVFPVVIGIFLATSLQDSHIVHLPVSAQRSLAFLPGDWDPEILGSTTASNDFRQRIQQVYLKEDASKSPLLGNGLSFDTVDFENYNYLAQHHEMPDGYYGTKIFVTGKMFHSGWISLYDAVGLIGFAAFLSFMLSLIWVSGRMVLQKGVDRSSPLFPLKVWMFCNILPPCIGYFTVFGDFKNAFPGFCYIAILLVHLNRIEKFGYHARVPVREVAFSPARTHLSQTA